jgi:hypothetical protein
MWDTNISPPPPMEKPNNMSLKTNKQTKTTTIVIPFCPYFVQSSQGKIIGTNNTKG